MKQITLGLLSVIIFITSILFAEYNMRPGSSLKPVLPTAQELTVDVSWRRLLAIAVATIAGIVLGYLFKRFSELHANKIEQVNVLEEIRHMFSATNFYLGLFASPIVFAVIIAASKEAPMLASLLLAFQNGFFWQSIMPKGKV
jgi:hypothetical protein